MNDEVDFEVDDDRREDWREDGRQGDGRRDDWRQDDKGMDGQRVDESNVDGQRVPSTNDDNVPSTSAAAHRIKTDRQKTCPFLVRVYCRLDDHHRPGDYGPQRFPRNEILIHTWPDATLRELTSVLQQQLPECRDPHAALSFRSVHQHGGTARFRRLGVVEAQPRVRYDQQSGRKLPSALGGCDERQLGAAGVQGRGVALEIGDMLDVAVVPVRRAHHFL